MSHYLDYALVEQSVPEEAAPGTMGAVLPARFLPELKNYAAHDETRERFINELTPIMDFARRDRQAQEEEWETVRNMNLLKHDAGRRYFGRSDVYLPIYKRERSKLVSTLSTGLFPSDEYFDCVDRNFGPSEDAKAVKGYMQWELEDNAKLRSQMKPFLSQLVDYGTSPLKFWYRKDIRSEGRAKRINIPGLLDVAQYKFGNCVSEGLAVSVRNLLFWYIYPATADSLEQAEMVFEDIDVPYSFVIKMKNSGRWENVDQVMQVWANSQHDRAMQMLLDTRSAGSSIPGRSLGQYGQIFTFTEVWGFMELPGEAYLDHETKGEPLPVRVCCVNDFPVEIRRNPFFHQRAPYTVSRIDWEPGYFYGNAQGRIIRPLQLLANDFMNQTNDNGIMAMNPVTLINPGMMLGKPRPFAPGVPWYVMDVDKAVKFDRPPMEQVPLGLQMSQLVIGLAQDSGGAPPDRGTMSKGAKTATGMAILQKNALSPLQDVVEDIEVDTLVPLLKGGWKNAIQYRDQEVMAIVAGQPIKVTPEQLAIDAHFRWLASSQATNVQVRNQQAITLVQAVAPIVPLLNQQGYIVDFAMLIKRVFDGMGFRGFQEFIRKAEAAPGAMPGMMVAPEQMGGVQAEQGDRLRSALDQLGGGPTEAQPGEAEDFNEIRQQADAMAAAMGGGGQY